MGSTIEYVTCPRCKSKESMFIDFNYRSGEETGFCTKCGRSFSHTLKRDSSNKPVREMIHSFDLAKSQVFYVKMAINMNNWKIQKILHKIPVTANDTVEEIKEFINMRPSKKSQEKFKEFEMFKETENEFTSHNIYFIDGEKEPLQLWYNTTKFEISDGCLKVHDVVWENEESEGYGVVKFKTEEGAQIFPLNEGQEPELTDDVVYASVVRDGKLIVLKGE